MNEIQIFNNPQFGNIRTAGTPDNPLFCLADVCKALELRQGDVVRRIDKGVVSTQPLETAGGTQMANFVNEDGLYDVILDSRKPEAKTFRKWVTGEVLPSIRKTGQYGNYPVPQTFSQALLLAAKQQEQIEQQRIQLEEQGEEIEKLANEVMAMKPKATYYDVILNNPSTVAITQIAQDYGMSAKKFNKILADFRIQRKVNKQWILYANYLDKGYVQSKPFNISNENNEKVVYNTEWTQKGRLFIYEKLKHAGIVPLIENKELFT